MHVGSSTQLFVRKSKRNFFGLLGQLILVGFSFIHTMNSQQFSVLRNSSPWVRTPSQSSATRTEQLHFHSFLDILHAAFWHVYIYILWIILASTMIHASHSKRSDPFFKSQYIKLRHSIQLPRIARCYLFSTIFSMLQFPRGQIRHLQHPSIHKTTAFNPNFQDNKMWSYSFH